MEKFVIAIEEMICQKFVIAAETAEEAMGAAEKLYKAGTFVLDNAELCTKQMAIIAPGKETTEWREF